MGNIPSRANLHTGYSSCWVLEISYHIPSRNVKVMGAHESEHLSNILVYESVHITKKGGMLVIKVSFSQGPGWFHGSQVWWNTTLRDKRMGYKKPIIPPKVTATCNIHNHTPIYSTSHHRSIVVHHHLCSQNMSTKGFLPKTPNMAPLGGQFGSQWRHVDDSGSSDNGSRTTTGTDSRSTKHATQYQPPHGYDYPPTQQPFSGAPQFHHHSTFNLTRSSQPTTSVSQQYPGYGPPWQGYDHHQGGYGESRMFPQQQFPGQGPSSPGALRVPPGPPGNNAVNQPTSSGSTPPPGAASSTPGRPPIRLPMKQFVPPAEPWNTDVARTADLPPMPEISSDDYYAVDKSDDHWTSGGAECKPAVSLEQTEFFFKQFAKRMGQSNYSAFNEWKKVCVAGFLEKKHRSIIRGQNRLKVLRGGPLHWETAVADFLETFERWLSMDNFDNAEWIRRQWVEMILMKCVSEIRESRK